MPSDSHHRGRTSAHADHSALPRRELHNLALGIERIGLIPLRFPAIATFALIVLCVAAAFGVERIKVDDSLSQLFRSDTPEFKQYEAVTHRFPSSEFDVLVVVEGKSLLERGSAREAARSGHRPAADRRHARHHLAVLGAPAAGRRRTSRAAVPRGAAARRRLSRADRARAGQRDHPRQAAVGGRRTGADRARARSRRSPKATGSAPVVGEIRKTMAEDLAGCRADRRSSPACR